MAEPLKNQFGIETPQKIAVMIAGMSPNSATKTFLKTMLEFLSQAVERHFPAKPVVYLPLLN